MTISVVCGQCAQAYEIDQDKYGGKKIKCKKCATVIEVPRPGESDDFEVVDETVSSSAPIAAPSSQEVLARSRLVGLKSAVAISQLQRDEASRKAIRSAVLQKHGDEKKRLEWRKPLESKVASILAELGADEGKIAEFKGFLAKQSGGGGYFKAFSSEFQSMFEQAVKVLGAPVRPLPPGTDFGARIGGLVVDGVLGLYTGRGLLWGKQQMEDKNKAIAEANGIAMETIQEAATRLEAALPAKRDALESATVARDVAFRQREEQDVADIQRIDELIVRGDYAEATGLGSKLLKRAPLSDVGAILVLLSRSAFLSGNQADAARLMQDAICFGMPAPGGMSAAYNDLWTKAEAGLPGDTDDATSVVAQDTDDSWVVVIEDWGPNRNKCIELIGQLVPDRPPNFSKMISDATCTQIVLLDCGRDNAERFVQMIRQGGVSASLRFGARPSESGGCDMVIRVKW